MTLAEALLGTLPSISRNDFNNLICRVVDAYCSGGLPETLFADNPMKLIIRKITVADDVKLCLSKSVLNDLSNVKVFHKACNVA